MKGLGIAVMVASLLCAGGALAGDAPAMKMDKPSKTAKAAKKFKYVCPMDGYAGDKPGQCPKCGMELKKREVKPAKGAQKGQRAKAVYLCPMDGTKSDKPGKCPKCGMELQRRS